MSLLSPTLVVALVLLALVCVAGTVVLWPRLAATRLLTVLGRLGLLLLVNVSVLLLAFVLLNDQFQFFSDWADLVGSASSQSTAASAGGSAGIAVSVPLAPPSAGPPAQAIAAYPAYGGMVYRVAGAASGVVSRVLVQLPPGYDSPANAHRRYPVLVGMGGYPAPVTQLAKLYSVTDVQQQLAAKGVLGPVINVYPLAEMPPGRDTECVDGPGDSMETWLATDVMSWVRATFRTAPTRAGWAVWGESTGGYCAAMLAMLHPDEFSAAITFGGYFRPIFGNWLPWAPGDPAASRYDLVTLAHRAPPPVALWLFAGRGDPYAFPSTGQLLKAARAPLAVTATLGSGGGHRVQVWRPWLPVALTWLAHTDHAFA